jgi:hypothetical protein
MATIAWQQWFLEFNRILRTGNFDLSEYSNTCIFSIVLLSYLHVFFALPIFRLFYPLHGPAVDTLHSVPVYRHENQFEPLSESITCLTAGRKEKLGEEGNPGEYRWKNLSH